MAGKRKITDLTPFETRHKQAALAFQHKPSRSNREILDKISDALTVAFVDGTARAREMLAQIDKGAEPEPTPEAPAETQTAEQPTETEGAAVVQTSTPTRRARRVEGEEAAAA